MDKGIHNPFEKPKPKSKKIDPKDALDYINTESPLREPSKAIFDCGTHVIIIYDVKSTKAATLKLVEFFSTLSEQHADFLQTNGLRIVSNIEPEPTLTPTELQLKTTRGTLVVDTGHDVRNEDGAMRRIADTLLRLPDGKDMLKQNKMTVYKRR